MNTLIVLGCCLANLIPSAICAVENVSVLPETIQTKNTSTVDVDSICPDVKPMVNVEAEKVAGLWYLLASNNKSGYEPFDCTREYITFTDKNFTQIEGNLTFINRDNITEGTYQYNAELKDPTIGELRMHESGNWTLKLVNTDYENYAIYYCCTPQEDGTKYKMTFIEARKPELPEPLWDKIYKELDDAGIDKGELIRLSFDYCPSAD